MKKRLASLTVIFFILMTCSVNVFALRKNTVSEEPSVNVIEQITEETEETEEEIKEDIAETPSEEITQEPAEDVTESLDEENTEEPKEEMTEEKDEQPLMTSDFELYVKIPEKYGTFKTKRLCFNLFLKDGTWLSYKELDVSGPGINEVVFPIGEYEVGTEFNLVVTAGLESYTYYGPEYKVGEECLIGTYAYRDENGELIICNDGFIEVKLTAAPLNNSKEDHVNGLGVWSNTPYLVWVSKANFTVNVFLKDNGRWNLIKEFPCSIGAPSTPTITGQYTYHQYQPKWQYSGYYVGPIMRFHGGYALHSTLVNNNGTDRDGRVGEQISHGCVRLRPSDINWLVNYVPLDTKIYITNE